jgi:hypothetical protein
MKSLFALFFNLFVLHVSIATTYQIFEENGKVGLKNETGAVILPASYEALGWSDGTFSVIGQVTGYRSKNQWGLLNLKKEFVTKADYQSLTYSGGDHLIATKRINSFTYKLGCLDLSGKPTIPFQYDGIKINGLRAIVFVKNGSRFEYGLVDLNDRGILPLKYKNIESLGSLRYSVQNFDNKLALFTEDGNKLTDFVIDSLSSFTKGWSIVYQNFKQGLLNRDGEIKVDPTYREIKIKDDGSIAVRLPDTWKIVDQQNKEQVLFEADDLIPETGYYKIKKSGKTGTMNKDFKIQIPPQYDYIGPFIHNKTVAKKENKFGILRADHSVVMPFLFDSLVLEGRLIRVKDKTAGAKRWMLFDTVGVQKSQNYYDFIDGFNGRFFPVRNKNFYGATDAYGKEIIHCVYDSLLEVKNDLVVVKFKGQYGIISMEEKWLLKPQSSKLVLVSNDLYLDKKLAVMFLKSLAGETIYFTSNPLQVKNEYLLETFPDGHVQKIDFNGRVLTATKPIPEVEKVFPESEGMRGVKRDGKFGFIDSEGRLRVANRYENIGVFKEGLAPVKILGKWGYVTPFDKIIINPTYEQVNEFGGGCAVVKRNGKTGMIDRDGKVILVVRYDKIERQLDNKKFILTLNNLKGLADEKGNVLIEPRFDQLDIIDDDHILVSNGKWGVLSSNGLSLVPMIYDQLLFVKEKGVYLALKNSEWQSLELQ